ncbi:MAG: L-serine ammonia-lyase [Paracoccaceae bacterium]|nr:L-serine ammonia-lyase [Paracoccaceae bacterium]
MFQSVLDIFKIGLGPSSSHTIGPMIAASNFLRKIKNSHFSPYSIKASLHGSLAFTGKGHATDKAIILGLSDFKLNEYNEQHINKIVNSVISLETIQPKGMKKLKFSPKTDIIFDYEKQLTGHPNGMQFFALDAQNDVLLTEIYYSVGGGAIVTEHEMNNPQTTKDTNVYPYPFKNASEMLSMAAESGKSISEMKLLNENIFLSSKILEQKLFEIAETMNDVIDRGIRKEGILPGGLNVKRRAKSIYDSLQKEKGNNLQAPHIINDWISVYAMAVNEENANGGQVVTAPTNGAAGVIPATLRYYLDFVPQAKKSKIPDFLLTCAAIGGIIKYNASISGAECGCQAEVGSASAMAAAGLCELLGGSPKQVENAAEIALEHHLGMTCDPIKGLVQVPCIERNGLGAIKAISAASLSLRGDGNHIVSLDSCIETMRQTGRDMNMKYKETALGGLAVNVPNC